MIQGKQLRGERVAEWVILIRFCVVDPVVVGLRIESSTLTCARLIYVAFEYHVLLNSYLAEHKAYLCVLQALSFSFF